MDVRSLVDDIEAALREANVSVARLCRRADLQPTSWMRWKAGRLAQPATWARVTDALDELVPGASARLQPKSREAA